MGKLSKQGNKREKRNKLVRWRWRRLTKTPQGRPVTHNRVSTGSQGSLLLAAHLRIQLSHITISELPEVFSQRNNNTRGHSYTDSISSIWQLRSRRRRNWWPMLRFRGLAGHKQEAQEDAIKKAPLVE